MFFALAPLLSVLKQDKVGVLIKAVLSVLLVEEELIILLF